MPKYYTTLRVTTETYKKAVKAKGVLESKTGEIHSLAKTVDIALTKLLSS